MFKSEEKFTLTAKYIADKLSLEMKGNNRAIKDLGWVHSRKDQFLSYAENKEYLKVGLENPGICVLITRRACFEGLDTDKAVIFSDNPHYSISKIQEHLANETDFYNEKKANIIKTAKIHKTATIAENNVYLGNNVIIGPHVIILENTHIEDNVRIQAGTVIGAEGTSVIRYNNSLLFFKHGGSVYIDQGVEVGANSVIDKGVFNDTTFIGKDCQIGSFCYISHNDRLGQRVILTAKCAIGGNVVIKDDVWVGLGAAIVNGATIGEKAFISIGAVVTKDIEANSQVSGNFAIEHTKFINFIKSIR